MPSTALRLLTAFACATPSLLMACAAAPDKFASVKPAVSETVAANPVLAERHETPDQHDARMKWFRDARFGLFIHWGLYAQYEGEWNGKRHDNPAEWIMNRARIPIAPYAEAAKGFNPANYDAEQWVLAAKDAGVKYIVITTKHHEGFAMFKTAASPFNIVDATPFKRDPIGELVAACRKHGMKLGFYYSQNLDWHHPGGGGNTWDPASKGDSDKYVDQIVVPQVKEILGNYGPIDILWWDIPGGHDGVMNKARADRINAAVMAASPGIIMNNRLGGGYHGDIETPEQHIPATGFPGKDWESCMTMNNTWGFSKFDHAWKSPENLIHNLCDIASKGGNYLLNVGPTPKGEIPAPSLERLAVMGKWLKVNGEAIYGTRASLFPKKPDWGRFTTRRLENGDTKIYAIVFNAPKDGVITLDGLANPVVGAEVIGGGEAPKAQAAATGRKITLTLPESLRARKDFVVALTLKGAPDTGRITLQPFDAKLTGGIQSQTPGTSGLTAAKGEPCLGAWSDAAAAATWQVKGRGQTVAVKLRLAAPATSAGSVITVSLGDQTLEVAVPTTKGWNDFQEVAAGKLRLPVGESALTLRAKVKHGEAPCKVGKIELVEE